MTAASNLSDRYPELIMGYKFNPFTGKLDTADSPNGVFEEIEVNGDITLDDGGTLYDNTTDHNAHGCADHLAP
jgi:hypothetical protein